MNFRDKWLPVFQAPDTPTSPAPSAPSDSGSSATPSASSATSPSSSTPSTLPSDPPTGPSGDDAPSSFEFMFDSAGGDPLNGPSDSGLSPLTVASPTTASPQTAPAQPEKPAATTPEPGKQPTTATPAPTEAASPTQPQTTEAQPNLDPYDPGTLAAHLAQNEEQVIQHVADNVFKLSDKDVEELESNAVGTIPKLLARTLVTAQRNFLMQMANLVPRMIQAHGEVTKRHSEAEGEFYSRWPDLKKDQSITVAGKPTTVNQLVMQYASVYRQMNPQASRKDAIEYVGPMVMMAAGVTPSTQPPAQSAPVASPMTNGTRPPQPTPFSPAGALAGGAVPSTRPELSPVEALFAPDQ